LAQEEETLAQLATRQEALTQAGKALEQSRGQAQVQAGLQKDLTEKKTAREAHLPRLAQAEEAWQIAQAGEEQVNRLTLEAEALRSTLPAYEEADRLSQERDKLAREKERAEKAGEAAQKALAEASAQEAGCREELASLAGLPQEKDLLRLKGEELDREKEALARFQARQTAWEKQEKAYAKALRVYEQAAAEAQEKEARAARLERAFLDEQAGYLARGLTEGQPCPVCGSLHHPQPASLTREAPTEEAVEQAKAQAQEADALRNQVSKKAGEEKARLASARQEWEDQAAALFGPGAPEERGEQYARRRQDQAEAFASLREAQGALEEKIRRRETLERKTKGLAETIAAQQQAAEREAGSVSQLTTRLAQCAAQLESRREPLAWPDRSAAQGALQALEGERDKLAQDIAKKKKAYEEAKETGQTIAAAIETLEGQLAGAPALDLAALTAQAQENRQAQQVCQGERETLLTRHDANRRARETLAQQLPRQEEAAARLGWMKALSDTANGTLSGKDKVMLETYVQMTWFDRILAKANVRLMAMTGGQYELRRGKGTDQRSQTGLELEVVDHFKGARRSVKTLSGGESFQASLALALGLADELQGGGQGVQMDTLFVDEGFGSLDEEALEQAVRTLVGLTEGNKLVGIISHVAPLKARIDRQIVVKKTRSGSSKIEIQG
jgi:exonuclease SbcC